MRQDPIGPTLQVTQQQEIVMTPAQPYPVVNYLIDQFSDWLK